MSEQGSTLKSSSAAKVYFLDLCEVDVKIIENVVAGGELLNRRQCEDLSSKLSETNPNIRELVEYCGAASIFFGPVLGNLYRHVEKAKVLVSECARKDWYVAAVFQCENENAFREILLDVGFCYSAIYELVKSKSEDWCNPPEDFRNFIFLDAALDSDVDEGESYIATMWSKALEPTGSWSKSHTLGHGSSGVVCSTTWLGILCAKKFLKLDTDILFMKEAGIFAHLKHPCIVDFICCGNGSRKGDYFICMELMEMSLFDLIQKQRYKGEFFSVGVVMDMML